MEVIATNKFNLEPFALPFAYSLVSKPKSTGEESWFTPSGKAKIWFGALHTQEVGNITEDERKELNKAMVEVKADVLWNGKDNKDLYTTCSKLTRLLNVNQVLTKLIHEWDSRKDWEEWESL